MECNIVEVGGVKNNAFTRNKFCTKDKIKENIQDFTGDKYMTIYSYENKETDVCNFIAPLYLDLDIDDIENNFNKLMTDLKQIIYRLKTEFSLDNKDIDIYFSGSKGFHIIVDYRIMGFEPSRTLNKDLKKIALYYKAITFTKCVDTKIYDYKRLLRIPNTINTKTGLYKVYIPFSKLTNMTWEELKEYASAPKKTMPKIHKINTKANEAFYSLLESINKQERNKINTKVAREYMSQKKLLPCVQYLLQNGACSGQRNNSTVAIANSLFQNGYELDEVMEILTVWNENKNDEPLNQSELRATVLSAQNNSKNNVHYGCSTFKDLNACVKNCPIHR